jgi:hypothetical protein
MSGHSGIPDEWRDAAEFMASILAVADAVARRRYPGGCAPAGTVPALVIALSLSGAFFTARNGRQK